VKRRLLRDGYIILVVVFVGLRLLAIPPWADSVDAFAYWTTRTGDFYATAETGRIGAYLYSPAFAQLLAPLVLLPLAVFTALWTAINCAAVWWLFRGSALASLLFLPIPFEIISGNVHLLYAVAIVVGFRWPATWALMLLTKVTPGIGLLWFAGRREWRSLFVALAVTAAVAGASYVLDPASWRRWVELLSVGAGTAGGGSLTTVGYYLPVPLLPRLVLAALVVLFASLTNRRWLVPVAVVLALPVIWSNSLAILAAVYPLWRARSNRETVPPDAEPRIGPAAALAVRVAD
jgi:general stress protein CsbA